eukprot:CAMPEP_0175075012 /NCGR_PEP_ID=MMETSP0052_2-20121109/21704_1 /TAXON_ID=51329 ORGANISM="Polytomella parva, Strain SAG 63-3" /NCGR_SAMPLE_ID=MMETSP0052_2 /ASSEMBLY_ACC=CAM_ASM_000194 /LENGTH=94 /DNA_ID=CAMNT_0016343531 /DNA_START=148 /DNA_END=429 /DNA_ORIENTATION=-
MTLVILPSKPPFRSIMYHARDLFLRFLWTLLSNPPLPLCAPSQKGSDLKGSDLKGSNPSIRSRQMAGAQLRKGSPLSPLMESREIAKRRKGGRK